MFNPLKWHSKISKIINDFNPEIDTSIGTFVGDTVVLPLAVLREILDKTSLFVQSGFSLDSLLQILEDPEKIQDIATALDITPQEVVSSLRNILENIAKDYGITRYSAQTATGIVYYIPTNFDIGVYTVSTNLRVKSVFGLFYEPEVAQVFTVTNENADSFYVPFLGSHAFPVRVRCTTPGRVGNIGPQQIDFSFGHYLGTQWARAINITPIIGGRDLESDRELVERIKSKWTGTNLGTFSGYKNLLKQYNVTDVYIAGPGDPFMKRAVTGAIDIYIRDYTVLTDVITILLDSPILNGEQRTFKVKDLLPEYMYVRNVVSTDSSIIIEIVQDNSDLWKWSTRANDIITIKNESGSSINSLSVNVTYNATLTEIQKVLDLDENRILGLDVLVREAWPLNFRVSFSIVPMPGYSRSNVTPRVIESIQRYVTSLRLGAKVAKSDLINVVEDVSGVDTVTSLQLFIDNQEVEEVRAKPIEFLTVSIVL